METKDIFILVLVFAAVGFSLYRKYIQKKNPQQNSGSAPTGSKFSTTSKDDDYEPYSGKK